MFIAGNLLEGIATVVHMVLELYKWVIIIRVFVSWFNPDPYNFLVQLLSRITDPVLSQIRYQIQKRFGLGMGGSGFDFTPIIAILLIVLLQIFVVESLRDIAIRMN